MKTIKIDWAIIFFCLTTSFIGVMALYGGSEYGQSLAKKQLVWLFLGLILMIVFAFFNYQNLGTYAAILYGAGILLLIITLLAGTETKGAKSWLRLGGIGFQPAEFMKLALVIALAKYLSVREKRIANINELLVPFVMTFIPQILIAVQPDLSYAVLLLPILFVMLFLAGANVSILLGFVAVGFLCLFAPMYLEYHKYIIIDDIVQALRPDNYKLSDAVHILGFESWRYVDKPGDFAGIKPEVLGWAKATLLIPENIEMFKKTAQFIFAQEKHYLRDFLANDKAIIAVVATCFITYGITMFLYFYYYKIDILKNVGTVTLILGLAFAASFVMKKTVSFKPHQVIRIVSFANPDKFPKGAGYQLRHSIITIGSGKVFGKGFGNGDMTKGEISFLPEWYNDFIFSVIGEQFGIIGNTTILILLFGLILRGVSITWKSKDQFGMLLAAGINTMFFLHVVFNTGIAMGLLPVTGVPLIFVSYGGSNMVFSCIAVGILLNIYMRRFINIK
ncbi:MAG: rod shape-determining protein RodA [Spirochaetia bacterium]|nr:rod shape-determining protein RodA [Spirochaetia bacterium]